MCGNFSDLASTFLICRQVFELAANFFIVGPTRWELRRFSRFGIKFRKDVWTRRTPAEVSELARKSRKSPSTFSCCAQVPDLGMDVSNFAPTFPAGSQVAGFGAKIRDLGPQFPNLGPTFSSGIAVFRTGLNFFEARLGLSKLASSGPSWRRVLRVGVNLAQLAQRF